ncbi:MAG: hypothetical protein ABSE79_12245 [Terriglobia bacterium]
MSGKRSKPEAGVRGRDMVWSSILTLTIMGVSQRANPRTPAPTALRVRPMVKLRIHNYGISRTLLLRSEGEATAILNHAGLAVRWVDCPLSAEDSASYPGCLNTMGSTDFTIRILTVRDAQRIALHRDALGEALQCLGDHSGCSAYIFYREVQELARKWDASESELLGHALAHEIGHLLLGANSHSSEGIMRANWRQQELNTIARAHLFFTDEQSKRMCAEVSALNSDQHDQTQNNAAEDPQEVRNSTDEQKR